MITLPKDDLEKQEILKKIAAKFEEDKTYSEDEVNEMIKSFDVEDHVLIRRELVNFNYLGKDSYKGEYWLKKKELSEEELEKINENQGKINKWNMET
ncbi:MAG: DUF2087 domain-containing protein [Nanoarchaeota archaeon]|nr:DUF2087 domain-containing protein [Nanoarchaeota archaeon]MBU1322365.1 DUF2087 domain-containing protein [Nanoarchaeota archaeon]MBU1598392.1 DUF2087 domain-containing protein [Nanoarchaeota archaeon]MBU2440769.1 DUF2087 domain-containing protein [Nanoarchaeota archaeon]